MNEDQDFAVNFNRATPRTRTIVKSLAAVGYDVRRIASVLRMQPEEVMSVYNDELHCGKAELDLLAIDALRHLLETKHPKTVEIYMASQFGMVAPRAGEQAPPVAAAPLPIYDHDTIHAQDRSSLEDMRDKQGRPASPISIITSHGKKVQSNGGR